LLTQDIVKLDFVPISSCPRKHGRFSLDRINHEPIVIHFIIEKLEGVRAPISDVQHLAAGRAGPLAAPLDPQSAFAISSLLNCFRVSFLAQWAAAPTPDLANRYILWCRRKMASRCGRETPYSSRRQWARDLGWIQAREVQFRRVIKNVYRALTGSDFDARLVGGAVPESSDASPWGY